MLELAVVKPSTRGSVRAALFCSLLLLAGCARGELAQVEPEADGPLVVRGVSDGRVLSLESRPSTTAAALLPSGARYRLVIAPPEQLALVIVTPDDRIRGRLRIRPLDGQLTGVGSSVEIDDFDGPAAKIEAWPSPGGLQGEATVGKHSARWRVRLGVDGRLVGESWSARHGSRSVELGELRRARAISADIGALATELRRRGALEPAIQRELSELVVLAELALELSLRAWEGRGRAELPPARLEP